MYLVRHEVRMPNGYTWKCKGEEPCRRRNVEEKKNECIFMSLFNLDI